MGHGPWACETNGPPLTCYCVLGSLFGMKGLLWQKMAQWGPIAEDDGLAGRKCKKGASPSTDKVESLSHDAATTCAFVMMRPVANARLLLSQRISGCNRAPLVAFSDTRAQKQRNRNARQPASKQPTNVRRPNAAKARQCMPGVQKQASRGGDVKKCRHRKCVTR